MTRTILSGPAAAAALTVAVTQWGGVSSAAKNTKPQEIVVVPYPGKGAKAGDHAWGSYRFVFPTRKSWSKAGKRRLRTR